MSYIKTGAVLTADNTDTLGNTRILTGFQSESAEGINFYQPFGTQYQTGFSFYTQLKILPTLSTIKHIRGIHIRDQRVLGETFLNLESGPTLDTEAGVPITLTDFDLDEVVAELDCFINMGEEPEWTRQITLKDLQRGYFEKEYNKNNVNSIQFRITWLGKPYSLGDYLPMYLEVNTVDEQRPPSR